MVSAHTIAAMQRRILSWYASNKRDLPWRKTTDPYAILISETMLQQTQVDRVIPYYRRWLQAFPDFSSLAKADSRALLTLWSGLGYNSRALRLQKLAQAVMQDHGGTLPADEGLLRKLPGIGPYTARAVQAFAFNKPAAVVDTNIRRVLIHELHLPEDIALQELEAIAFSCIPPGKSRIWHNALMDYGALHKTARTTGIRPLSKQSRFVGSDRQVRGHILKQLVAKDRITLASVCKEFPGKDVVRIATDMAAQGLVVKDKKTLRIPRT